MEPEGIDFGPQIQRVDLILSAGRTPVRTSRARGATEVIAQHGLAARGRGQPEVIVSERVAAELGKPPAPSTSLVLTTRRADLIEAGRVRALGRPLGECEPSGGPWGYAQLLLVAVGDQAPDPFGLAATASLSARLPGLMSRASGGRLWLRFGHPLIRSGFDLTDLGEVLVAACGMDHPGVRAAEAVLICDAPDTQAALAPVVAEASVLSGEQRKLHLVGDSELVCDDLDCDNCDHIEVCDLLEDVRVRYRKRRTG